MRLARSPTRCGVYACERMGALSLVLDDHGPGVWSALSCVRVLIQALYVCLVPLHTHSFNTPFASVAVHPVMDERSALSPSHSSHILSLSPRCASHHHTTSTRLRSRRRASTGVFVTSDLSTGSGPRIFASLVLSCSSWGCCTGRTCFASRLGLERLSSAGGLRKDVWCREVS